MGEVAAVGKAVFSLRPQSAVAYGRLKTVDRRPLLILLAFRDDLQRVLHFGERHRYRGQRDRLILFRWLFTRPRG